MRRRIASRGRVAGRGRVVGPGRRRTFLPALAAVACLSAVPRAAAVAAQEARGAEDARAKLSGVVYDVVTGNAISAAAVSLRSGGQAALTDGNGVFQLEDVESGPQLLAVTQFGYRKRMVATTVEPGTSGMLEVALTPRPVMVEGVTATVENVTEMESRLRFRRRASGASTWAYDRRELFRATTGTPLDFLRRRTLVRVVVCPPGRASSRCVYRRGRAVEPWVYVDEAIAFGGLDELETYAVSDVYLMEVYGWGSEIRIYTNDFMERMARKPIMLIPVGFRPRGMR